MNISSFSSKSILYTHTQTEYIHPDENECEVIIPGMTAAEFCISCRRSLRNSDNWNEHGNEQGSF